MNKGSAGVRFSITVPDDQICGPGLFDKPEKMWLGTRSWVRSKPCSECGSTRFIECESLERRLDRMADEAKAEIADMAGSYLYSIGASSVPFTPFQKKLAAAWKTLEINLGRFS